MKNITIIAELVEITRLMINSEPSKYILKKINKLIENLREEIK